MKFLPFIFIPSLINFPNHLNKICIEYIRFVYISTYFNFSSLYYNLHYNL